MKILIAVDDSAESRQAVDAAYQYFGQGHDYTVLAVSDPDPSLVAGQGAGAFTSAVALRSYVEQALEAAANTAVARAQQHLPTASDTAVVTGRTGSAICKTAVDCGSDLIVIGSHDKSFWERLVDPSVGRYLVDNAPCPVLIVR